MKKVLILLLGIALLMAGCATGGSGSSSQAPSLNPAAPPSAAQPSSQESSQNESSQEESRDDEIERIDPLEGLVKDEYEGLQISAAVLERKAILPGSAIPVTVTVQNTGDTPVVYVQGSGSFTTPEALLSTIDGLQPVLSQDRLGVATMDFVTKELKPGDELTFKLYVMAIEPSEKFDAYTHDHFNESQTYIAEAEWDALKDKHDDLVAVQPGSYQGHVYFRYHMNAENPLAEATAYAQADYVIGVS